LIIRNSYLWLIGDIRPPDLSSFKDRGGSCWWYFPCGTLIRVTFLSTRTPISYYHLPPTPPPPSKPPNHSYISPPCSDVTLHYCTLPPHSTTLPTHLTHINIPRYQGYVEDHVSKYTCHNQMMTSAKRKLAREMSTSDIRKLRHSRRFTSRVSSPTNVKITKVPKDEGLNFLSVVRSKDHFRCILNRWSSSLEG
jgi:hypothetical protein